VPIDLILLQETWDIKYPQLLDIPGFQNIVYRTRVGMRGGGVGIYIRNGLNFKERTDLENYKLKTFENIVLEVQYPNKSILVSNIYRSPNPPPNISVSDHIDLFLDTLDTHLARLSDLDKNSYIFTDSNINLLKLNEGALGTDYMDTLITNGYLQIISKATRVQNNNVSHHQ
jgi:exonuclease III